MLKKIVATALVSFFALANAGEALPAVELYMPKPCLACIDWADYLMANGFTVTFKETADMAALKRRLKVPVEVESVHTALVGGYFVEGHVPADDIKELLRDKPKARGIAVPGLPMGAPGREATGSTSSCETGCTILEQSDARNESRREMYNTLIVGRDGKTSIFARH